MRAGCEPHRHIEAAGVLGEHGVRAARANGACRIMQSRIDGGPVDGVAVDGLAAGDMPLGSYDQQSKVFGRAVDDSAARCDRQHK